MALSVVTGHRWTTLLDELAVLLRESSSDPFAWSRVVVSSAATGRIVGQEVAARLGISAGIAYPTPRALMAELAESAGVARDRSRWLGTPLELATWEAVTALSAAHPVLARAVAPGLPRPGGRRALASRLASLQRWYVDVAPELVAAWLDGGETTLDGAALPEHLAWQPALVRATTDLLEVDPLATLDAIAAAAREDTVPTVILAVDELTAPQLRVIGALAEVGEPVALQPVGSRGEAWATALAASTRTLPDSPAPRPEVSLHDSHGPARQVEVLREELTRAFEADPTLEPRQVAIVCPRPERYAELLDAAFLPTAAGSHPGRELRVQQVGGQVRNPLVATVADLLRLGTLRATASALVELLLAPAIAHRWRLDDRQLLVELVSAAGVHWGLDETHRASFQLPGLTQNTWLRGLDRLLVGLTVSAGHEGDLGISGSDQVASSDLTTVGSLCEILSRLRRHVAETATSETMVGWVRRTRTLLDELVGLPRDDDWQRLHILAVLARFETDHAGSTTLLSRHEFAALLTSGARDTRARAAAGNGSLLVAPLGELSHVGLRLVALLGVTDDVVPGSSAAVPDAVDVGDCAPDPRERRLSQLLDRARTAEKVVIVRQRFSERTNDEVPPPSAITWLLDQLGTAPSPVPHPPTATSEANFRVPEPQETAHPGFDVAALRGALARRSAVRSASDRTHRRRQARRRPLPGPSSQQVSVAQLAGFLRDPAAAFLRSCVGITQHDDPAVTDTMPLLLRGLEGWAVKSALLEALKRDLPVDDVERRLRESETLPPQLIGKAAFDAARGDVEMLWGAARGHWQRDVTDHTVDLTFDLGPLGAVRLVDGVRCRGGQVVALTPSKGDDKLIEPWIGALALTAAGLPTEALLHRFVWSYGADITDQRLVPALTQEAALTQLGHLARAWAVGYHRLLPVPVDAALRFVADATRGRLDQAQWRGVPGFRHQKWKEPGRAWPLFYDQEVRDLFDDELVDTDPDGTGQPHPFGAWAVTLYTPLGGVL